MNRVRKFVLGTAAFALAAIVVANVPMVRGRNVRNPLKDRSRAAIGYMVDLPAPRSSAWLSSIRPS
jgi:hypothetical protein